jgi:thioredoxin reductase
MSETPDVAIIGGSFAGLTAALQLGRARRSVVVFDTQSPRNAASPAAHGVPGWDGRAPQEILAAIRRDLAAYPTVSLVPQAVTGLDGAADAFRLTTGAGPASARRVILALGVSDRLPAIPGLAEGWGKWVLHCPYCHGYEIRDRPLAVLVRTAAALHVAQLLRTDWSDDVTLILQTPALAGEARALAAERGLKLCPAALVAARGVGDSVGLTLADGSEVTAAALFLHADTAFAAPFVAYLRLATAAGPTGPYLQTGPFGTTSRAGLFAAGDLIRPAGSVTPALADGALAGIGAHQSLIWPDRFPPIPETDP